MVLTGKAEASRANCSFPNPYPLPLMTGTMLESWAMVRAR
jgi:hypothetical protein